jgi:dihydroorotate dehydrogenase
MISLLASAAMPALRLLDPEQAHGIALRALAWNLVPGASQPDAQALSVSCLGRRFSNPIGLAAGFDKNAAAGSALLRLGFGFVETGSVTPRPQQGNSRPRIFRLTEDRAIINRLGFNNQGLAVYVRNLARLSARSIPLGANVGINKEGANPEVDYPALVKAVSPYADYVTVNISSPNTPGLRDLQGEARLAGILSAISTDRPVFVKIAPDLSEDGLEAVVAACMAKKVAGLIVSNTTIARPASLQGQNKGETGGLSGAPLFAPSTAMLARAYRLAGRKLMLIGAGGISTPEDVLAKILAGASLVQVYTGFAYQGPAMIPRLKTGLAALLRARGFSSVADATGAGA